jgi:hypothetical protein
MTLLHSSPVLAESQPHTMHEDRAILDSILATNRNAIIDLHNLEQASPSATKTKEENHATPAASGAGAGTDVEIPLVPDVLPTAPRKGSVSGNTPSRGSFSRRGTRLGVHMSILDMGAHTAPDALKNKWIQTSRSHHPPKPTMTGAKSPERPHVRFPLEESPTKTNTSPDKKTPKASAHTRKTSQGWISSPTAGKLHKMIEHLEMSHSTGIAKLISHGRRRSSVSKAAIAETQTGQNVRRRRSTVDAQETP